MGSTGLLNGKSTVFVKAVNFELLNNVLTIELLFIFSGQNLKGKKQWKHGM